MGKCRYLLPVRLPAARRANPICIARAAGCEAPHKNVLRRPDGVTLIAGLRSVRHDECTVEPEH